MSGNNSSQDKTENATPKRKSEARKRAQIPRSKELTTFAILTFVSLALYVFSPLYYSHLERILEHCFLIDRHTLLNPNNAANKAKKMVLDGLLAFSPVFIFSLIGIYLGTIMLGGQVFSAEKIRPKLSNIAMLQGIKRIFSAKGLVELFQAIIKCCIIGVITYFFIKFHASELLKISLLPLNDAMEKCAHIILSGFAIFCFATILFASIDYPYQLYQHKKQLKMSKQEVRDEFKQTEGDPQTKGRIRQQQRRLSRRRNMVKSIEQANVVIVNPTHYAVALQYDEEAMAAPIIVAMGMDLYALHIRRLSSEHRIPTLEIPVLARALYDHGEIGMPIPEGLFYAVARVLAYIFNLDDPLSFHLEKEWIDDLPIPSELKRTL